MDERHLQAQVEQWMRFSNLSAGASKKMSPEEKKQVEQLEEDIIKFMEQRSIPFIQAGAEFIVVKDVDKKPKLDSKFYAECFAMYTVELYRTRAGSMSDADLNVRLMNEPSITWEKVFNLVFADQKNPAFFMNFCDNVIKRRSSTAKKLKRQKTQPKASVLRDMVWSQ